MLISICICTFRRRHGLQWLLGCLRQIQVPSGSRIEVVVVDNDPSMSAESVVSEAQIGFPWPLRYFCEARRGVGFARNRCVSEAQGEWVAFIDDDEYPISDWLVQLLQCAAAFSADGVFGPVVAEFESPPPRWIHSSGFHSRPRFATGSSLGWGDCRTGNVLFRRRLFLDLGAFDPRFSASGGEDSEFFWRCIEGGARMVWCDEAVVRERVPTIRMSRAWMLRRAFSGGRIFARLRASRGGKVSLLGDVLWGLLGVVAYSPLALVACCIALPTAIVHQRKLAGSFGKISALFGDGEHEYGSASTSKERRVISALAKDRPFE